jgi:hypothetical protein
MEQFVRFKANFEKEAEGEIPGRDLSEFLAEKLQQKGFGARSIENDEISFTVKVKSGSIEYPLMVCLSLADEDYWEVTCPRTLGRFARLRGKSEDTELRNLISTLAEIFQNEQTITDTKWYGDYDDRFDDYIQKPIQKNVSRVGTYLCKLFVPLWLVSMALIALGSIIEGKESLLMRLGTTLCFLVLMSFFGMIAVNIWLGMIYNIIETYRNGSEKKWLRWFLFLVFAGVFTYLSLMFIAVIVRTWLK